MQNTVVDYTASALLLFLQLAALAIVSSGGEYGKETQARAASWRREAMHMQTKDTAEHKQAMATVRRKKVGRNACSTGHKYSRRQSDWARLGWNRSNKYGSTS